jgi:hypothetical protein
MTKNTEGGNHKTDFEFPVYDNQKKRIIAETFIVIKLSNGDCHLVKTSPKQDSEITNYLMKSDGGIDVNPTPLPITFLHTDNRRFINSSN